MKDYSTNDVARMLDVPVGQVRSFARAGVLHPRRGARGEHRFTFRDLVLLRAAKGLRAARIPPRRIRSALTRLREQLPEGRPLTAVQIETLGDRVVVRDGAMVWQPESGQTCFDFEGVQRKKRVSLLPCPEPAIGDATPGADEWFEWGCELEAGEAERAREAYRRAIELEPDHVDARVNLGRLLQESGRPDEAEAHYRWALAVRPDDATALFNLAVLLEDRGDAREAIRTYRRAIEADPRNADAHFNLARLYEAGGDRAAAFRHLQACRRLTRETPEPRSRH